MRNQTFLLSNYLLVSVLDATQTGISITNSHGYFVFVNREFCNIYGYCSEELEGGHFTIIIADHLKEKAANAHDRFFELSVGTSGEWTEKTKDGGLIYTLVQSELLNLPDGQRYKVTTIQHISKQKTKEHKILFEKSQTEALINSSHDLIWSLNHNFELLAANHTYFQMVGLVNKKMLRTGDDLSEIQGYGAADEFWRPFYETALKGEEVSIVNHFEVPGIQEEIWLETKMHPIFDNEQISGVACYSRNITERKKAEEHLSQEKNMLRTLIDNIPDFIFFKDTDSNEIINNTASLGILGVENDQDTQGKSSFDYFSPEIAEKFISDDRKVFESGEPLYNIEEYIIGKHGIQKWLLTTKIPLKDDNGKVTGLVGISRDITNRKKEDEQIRLSNERFEKVTEATNEAIWDLDLDTNALYWGEGFRKLFGYDYPKSGLSMDTCTSHVHSDDLESVENSLQEALKNTKITHWQYEYRFIKKDNSTAIVIDRGAILRNGSGKAYRMVGAMQDITYRKEYEDSLKNLNLVLELTNQKLERTNQELEQFAYVASHDLQEPLRMITSFLTKLEMKYEEVLDEKGKKYIFFAVDGAKRMQQIILDLLEFSRLSQDDDHLEEIDLTEIMEEAKTLLIDKIENSGAQIVFKNLPVIQAKKAPIRQLFQGLLTNALKYKKEVGRPLISVSAREDIKNWEFSFEDNGIGISKAYFDKIFVIFQRLHKKEEYSGSGMGLAICKKIVENMGGKIWVESEQGVGSTFYFTIAKPENN